MLGEAALTRPRTPRATRAAYRGGHRRDRPRTRAPGRALAWSRARHLDQALGAASALRVRAARARAGRAGAARGRAGAARARRQRRRHHRCRGGRAPRALARRVRARLVGHLGACRLGRLRPRGAGLPEARARRDRLAGRARAPTAAGASWCAWSRAPTGTAEIKRAQVLGLAGYPVFTRKGNTDVSYLACAARMLAAPRRDLPAVRDAQRAHGRRPCSSARRAAAADFEFQRLHGMGEGLYDAGARPRRPSPAASTRRSAATRTCCPTWCAGCSRTAPTRRSSTASPIPRVPIEEVVADPAGDRRRERGGGRPEDSAAPRSLSGPAQFRGLRVGRRGGLGDPCWRSSSRCSRAATGAPRRACAAATLDGPEREVRDPASGARHRTRRAKAIGRGAAAARGVPCRARSPRPQERAAMLERAADAPRGTSARSSWRCSRARRARRCPTRWPRCARPSTSAAITRCWRAARFAQPARAAGADGRDEHAWRCTGAACSPASARGTSRSRSSPARWPRHSPRATPWSPSPPSRRRSSRRAPCALLHEAGVPAEALRLAAGRRRDHGRRAGRRSAHRRRRASPARPPLPRRINRALAARDGPARAADRRDRRT